MQRLAEKARKDKEDRHSRDLREAQLKRDYRQDSVEAEQLRERGLIEHYQEQSSIRNEVGRPMGFFLWARQRPPPDAHIAPQPACSASARLKSKTRK